MPVVILSGIVAVSRWCTYSLTDVLLVLFLLQRQLEVMLIILIGPNCHLAIDKVSHKFASLPDRISCLPSIAASRAKSKTRTGSRVYELGRVRNRSWKIGAVYELKGYKGTPS